MNPVVTGMTMPFADPIELMRVLAILLPNIGGDASSLRVCPRSFLFLTEFSEHEAD
jgi:hypothetical protein